MTCGAPSSSGFDSRHPIFLSFLASWGFLTSCGEANNDL